MKSKSTQIDRNSMEPIDWSHVFDRLYSETQYGQRTLRRASLSVEYVKKRVPLPAKVLEVGCGRGHILHQLRDVGYEVEGTELSEWIINNDLQDLNVHRLPCSELHRLPSDHYDVVISADVLEHLESEDSIHAALTEFCRLSKKWILISVGTGPSTCRIKEIVPNDELHLVIRKNSWWHNLYEQYCICDQTERILRSYHLFGWKIHTGG